MALISVVTRFGADDAGFYMLANKKGFQIVLRVMEALLKAKDCANAMFPVPNGGKVLSGCFEPSEIMEALDWKGLLIAPFMAVGSLFEYFQSELESVIDIAGNNDKYVILVSRFDFVALAPYVGDWYNGSLGRDNLVIKENGSGTEGLVCEGTFNTNYPTALVCWNATLQLTVMAGEVVGTYTSVSCQSGCNFGDKEPGVGASFKLALGDHDTLTRTWIGGSYNVINSEPFCGPATPQPWSGYLCNAPVS